eukprot:Clim_evm44s151 gene=Clim_evmTU44s151
MLEYALPEHSDNYFVALRQRGAQTLAKARSNRNVGYPVPSYTREKVKCHTGAPVTFHVPYDIEPGFQGYCEDWTISDANHAVLKKAFDDYYTIAQLSVSNCERMCRLSLLDGTKELKHAMRYHSDECDEYFVRNPEAHGRFYRYEKIPTETVGPLRSDQATTFNPVVPAARL